MRARPIGVLALAALAAALQSDVADAAIPPGIFYFCTDCGANSTMALQCNGTDLFGDGNYKGDGKFTLAVSIAGIPIMKFRGPSMCGQDTKVLLPGAAGALLVHGLDDCTGKKRLHWSGIAQREERHTGAQRRRGEVLERRKDLLVDDCREEHHRHHLGALESQNLLSVSLNVRPRRCLQDKDEGESASVESSLPSPSVGRRFEGKAPSLFGF